MYHFMDVPVRPVAGSAANHGLAADESFPFGRAPTGLIQLAGGSAAVLANGALRRRREARAR
jgi:hypothetical protein